jgi:tRNA-dihydrouridine synthase C
MPVSAKMRLGFNDDARAVECALAIENGGADELVVHARTRAQAYRPPAYWERIADIRAQVRLPVVANGDIWTVQDALRCREVSGCTSLMLGRGIVTDPGLALAIRAATAQGPKAVEANRSLLAALGPGAGPAFGVSWSMLLPLIAEFWTLVRARLERRQQAGRLKQWLNFLRRRYPQAEQAYLAVRTISDPAQIDRWLAAQLAQTERIERDRESARMESLEI